MQKKKILVILSGGYNVRNFIYSGFLKDQPQNFELVFWHTFPEIIELKKYKQEPLPKLVSGKLDWLKRTITIAELYKNYKKTKRKSYLDYLVLPSYKKNEDSFKIKTLKKYTLFLGKLCANSAGIAILNSFKNHYVKSTKSYKIAKEKLIKENFNLVFFTHQRASEALAVSVATNDLNINTCCFIYSWDNLPKGNKYIDAKNYFVWSLYMQNELLHYYPKIKKESIFVTGSPQFIHYKLDNFSWSRKEFCEKLNLDIHKKYICFSGNDKTTCPVDPVYLDDLAKAVRKLNESENIFHILFRPNPIDTNIKFNKVVSDNNDVITVLSPSWEGEDIRWNSGIPNYQDMLLLKNTIAHSELIINMSSTMSMDAAILNKPAIYIRYDVPSEFNWTVETTYNFVHFDALKGIEKPVIWLKQRDAIQEMLYNVLTNPSETKSGREIWIKKIIQHPVENANKNIWSSMQKILADDI